MKISKLLSISVMILGMSLAHAAKVDGAPAANCDGLKIATGKVDKGYSKLYGNIDTITNHTSGLCEVNSDGGLDNLTLLSKKKADIGIAQFDQLKFMAQGDSNIAALQVVATLNSNYLHIVVNSAGINVTGGKKLYFLPGDTTNVRIRTLSDLRGRPVVLVGSAKLLGRQLNKDMGLNMTFTEAEDDSVAFTMVQKGQVFAALTVAGWPHGPVDKLTTAQGLTLAAFDGPTNNPVYSVKSFSYKNMGVYNVPALAIQNVLLSRPFAGDKIKDVQNFKDLLNKKLTNLKDGDFEPAWNEIQTLDGKVDWAKFEAKNTPVTNKVKK